ncbi:LysR family transcriptional regulator [Undibacterium terreum]|uniref:LysR family transcriptional regulator n=2 Tax=Undibacterium terreum TaxID=1224302 RepID=A0A916V2A4_9BURK|nr:LysR family transcriptional regulator [Undibacterium terreum]
MHKRFFPFVGRLPNGAPFIESGRSKIFAFALTVAHIAAVGLPSASLAWLVAALVEISGGARLLANHLTRPAVLGMIAFLIATAIFFHSNLAYQNQMFHCLKNLMMAGGLLQIAYFGTAPLSLDERKSNKPAVV